MVDVPNLTAFNCPVCDHGELCKFDSEIPKKIELYQAALRAAMARMKFLEASQQPTGTYTLEEWSELSMEMHEAEAEFARLCKGVTP